MKPLRAATLPALDSVPGLSHGFEQRLGPAGWESRESGRERVAGALADHGRLLLLNQVHGNVVARAPWDVPPEADAALAGEPGLLLGIQTADCLPVLIVDARQRSVAAAHAGWRGSAAGVTTRAVQSLLASGSRAQDLLAALGPCIGPCCYEVGDELRAAFGSAADGLFQPGPRGRPHLDLRLANLRQLAAAGIAPAQVHHVADCTYCQPDAYHSFRRDGKRAGRMISFIGFATNAG